MRSHSSIAFVVLTGLLCVATVTLARDQARSLDGWVERELVPWLEDTLTTHPRFRDQTVRLVVMEDSNPRAVASALAIGLRDRVQDALMNTPGVRVYWHPARPALHHGPGVPALRCEADRVQYFVGIEVSERPDGRFGVSVRALDLEERRWVSGFDRTWHGALTAAEHRAWRELATDRSFLGERDVPFEHTQTDLLAAQLAHELGCSLLGQLEGEFVAAGPAPEVPGEPSIVELVSNNLVDYRALSLTDQPEAANARIEAQAHRVDDDLFQYWITIRPLDASSGLPALSASAYVLFAATPRVVEPVADALPRLPARSAAVLGPLELVALRDSPHCAGGRHCLALQTLARTDAVLFFLNHQVNRGLVRLGDRRCSRQPSARIARANELQRFSLPTDYPGPASWRSTTEWQLDPRAETLHVIAASDSKAARALEQHIARLPSRCTAAVRPGLEGSALAGWLAELERLAEAWSARVDWQVIRVRNVY